jgi:CDK-activating kinase assembly factor MAT1
MRIYVSSCYHKLCETCLNRIFSQGSAACPTCKTTILRKSNFSIQVFDDLIVEKEVRIRKLISSYLNKGPQDFSTEEEYNNYLEFLEDTISNLVNDQKVSETFALLEKFREENLQVSAKNTKKEQEESRKFAKQAEIEAQERQARRIRDLWDIRKEEATKKRQKEELIRELANSEDPAVAILGKKAKGLKASSMREQQAFISNASELLANESANATINTRKRAKLMIEEQEEVSNSSCFNALEGITEWNSPISGLEMEWKDAELSDWCSQSPQRASGVRIEAFMRFFATSAFY